MNPIDWLIVAALAAALCLTEDVDRLLYRWRERRRNPLVNEVE